MRREEELQNRQALFEVRPDRQFDDFTGRRSHQAAHAGQLGNLADRTAGRGLGHHQDRVEAVLVLFHLVQAGEDLVADLGRGLGPDVGHAQIALVVGEEALTVCVHDLRHARVGGGQHILLVRRDEDVVNRHGHAGDGGVVVAQLLDRVEHLSGLLRAMLAEAHIDDLAEVFLRGPLVDFQHEHVVQRVAGLKADILRHGRVEDETAQRAVDQAGIRLAFPFALYAHPDGRLQRERTGLVRHHRLVHIGESASGALAVSVLDGQVVAAHNHVLGGTDNRFAILRLEDVVRGQHQEAGFGLRLHRKRNVNGHLVAVEVGVKGGTGQRVQLDGFALNQHGLKGLNAQTVQRRRAVEQHRMLADHLFEDIPHLGLDALDHALGGFDVVGVAAGDELFHHEGLEQLDGHFLGQAALIQLQFRADDDN